jgi:uncharacterized protein YdhG (YjbR/CyaY superfamily)
MGRNFVSGRATMKVERVAGTIDEYVAGFSPEVQVILQRVRQTIRKAAPGAEETIKYRMPTFTLGGRNLVHFAGHQHHIGFYPTPSGIEQFQKELSVYENAKGSVQFPINRPIPYALIGRVTRFRVKENRGRTTAKSR